MGYNTYFSGKVSVTPSLSEEHKDQISDFAECGGAHPEAPDGYSQWKATQDGSAIEWDAGEKFYRYTEWLTFIVDAVLKPNGYVANGCFQFQGEEVGDVGFLVVSDNRVRVMRADDEHVVVFVKKRDVERYIDGDRGWGYQVLDDVVDCAVESGQVKRCPRSQ